MTRRVAAGIQPRRVSGWSITAAFLLLLEPRLLERRGDSFVPPRSLQKRLAGAAPPARQRRPIGPAARQPRLHRVDDRRQLLSEVERECELCLDLRESAVMTVDKNRLAASLLLPVDRLAASG